MDNFFGSIPEPEPQLQEKVHQWMPLWSYSFREIDEIKETAVRYDHNTYTMLEAPPISTNFFDN